MSVNSIIHNSSHHITKERIKDNTKPIASFEGSGKIQNISMKATTKIDALKIVIEVKKRNYDFYNRRGQNAKNDDERILYMTIVTEEMKQVLVLLDEYEYLKYHNNWNMRKEHHSFDGG